MYPHSFIHSLAIKLLFRKRSCHEWKTVLRIHDILVRIRIRGSMPLIMDPDSAIFVIDLQDANKKNIFLTTFSASYFLKVRLHNFSKINTVVKKSHKRFFLLFLHNDLGGPKICGSGSGFFGSWSTTLVVNAPSNTLGEKTFFGILSATDKQIWSGSADPKCNGSTTLLLTTMHNTVASTMLI